MRAETQKISPNGVARILIDGHYATGGTTEKLWIKYNEVKKGDPASIVTGPRNLQLLHHVKAGKTGRLEVIIRREGPLLLVTMILAKELKNMDTLFGDNDVYVKVQVNGVEKRTSTVKDAGARAVWGKGRGETLVFGSEEAPVERLEMQKDEGKRVAVTGAAGKGYLPAREKDIKGDISPIQFFVYDEDEDGADDLIGKARAPKQVIMLDRSFVNPGEEPSEQDLAARAKRAPREADKLWASYGRMGDLPETKQGKVVEKDKVFSDVVAVDDGHGAGDWHWHSVPALTLREDIGDLEWKEDIVDSMPNLGAGLGKLTGFAQKKAQAALDAAQDVTGTDVLGHDKKKHKKKHKKKRKSGTPGPAEEFQNPMATDAKTFDVEDGADIPDIEIGVAERLSSPTDGPVPSDGQMDT